MTEVRVSRGRGAEPGIIYCGNCGAMGRLPEFEPPHHDGCPMLEPKLCNRCGEHYDRNEPDPCLGHLPGVIFACCGHGDGNGYITFENNVCIRFDLAIVQVAERGCSDRNWWWYP